MNKIKQWDNTRKNFCNINPDMKKLRRNDPIQFDVLYREFVRSRQQRQMKLHYC